jgi:hypothetical protein
MSRVQKQPLVAIAVVVAVLALAPAAPAQQAPTLGAPTPQETAPPVTTTTAAADRGLKTWQELLIFGAGIVLLGGIAIAIIGDARERAPTQDRRPATEPGGAGPKRHRQRDKERAREKARIARAQRKRNRKR